jgi:hypothetical protein
LTSPASLGPNAAKVAICEESLPENEKPAGEGGSSSGQSQEDLRFGDLIFPKSSGAVKSEHRFWQRERLA